MTSTVRRFASLALLLVAFLCACDLEIQEQELRWRYDAQKDELHVLFLHHDIGSREPRDGGEKIVDLLAGRREFMFLDWPIYCDLDDADKGEVNPLLASIRAKLRVESALIGTRADGTLHGAQRVVVREWSAFLRDANAEIAKQVLRDLDHPGTDPDNWLDEATLQLCRQRAEKSGRWLGFDARGLYFDLPASPRGLARFYGRLMQLNADTDDSQDRAIFMLFGTAVEAIEPIADGVRIRIGNPDEIGWSLRAERRDHVQNREQLRAALKGTGVALAPFDEQRAIDEWLGRHAPNPPQGAR